MNTFWLGLAFLTAGGFAWWLRQRILNPLKHLRDALSELAGEEESPSLARLQTPRWPFRDVFRELQRVSARIIEMRRQISDESFNLRAILSSMVEGVLIVDANQRIRMANEGLHRMFSPARSPMNRSIMEVFRNHDLHAAIKETLETLTPQSRELTIEALHEGVYAPKHFEVTAVALAPLEKAHPIGAIAVFHDITRIKQLEAVRRDFVANVSHELRTPLSIINGYVETLLDGGLENRGDAERFLRVMAKHGERLNLLIEDLLTLSKLESSPRMRFERVDVRGCIERVLEQLERNFQQKSTKVEVEVAEEAAFFEADELRLEQALFNLLDNANKYGTRENPKIRVSVAKDGADLCLKVEDNGPGIPLADQAHIFERFYRVHKDRSRDAGGTGLGLSIVKHVAQAHGGSVALRSSPGGGTMFELRMPLK